MAQAGERGELSCQGRAEEISLPASGGIRKTHIRRGQRGSCQDSQELRVLNQSAAASLTEGLEETLTLHRSRGLFEKLGTSFKTTNVIESIQARLGQYTDKVDYWRNSDQKQRWVVAALSDLEPRLRRVKGMKYLPELRHAIQRELGIQKQEKIAA